MISPATIHEIMQYAASGTMPPSGDIQDADAVIGFSFGTVLTADGLHVAVPGSTNEALADAIVGDEIMRQKNMILQEELARAVTSRDQTLRDQVESIGTIKAAGKAYDTYEVMMQAQRGLVGDGVGVLAVVAFRHHLPRTVATVRKAGFATVIPDMRHVGDYPADSSQAYTRTHASFMRRERIAILGFAVLGRI